MRKNEILLALVVLLVVVAVNLTGCIKKKEPTNADIVKAAIQRAISEKCNIITPSISVVSKAVEGASWSITLRYQCGGQANSGKQQLMTLLLEPSRDGSGRTVWTAK
jgi:hypothetical protein